MIPGLKLLELLSYKMHFIEKIEKQFVIYRK